MNAFLETSKAALSNLEKFQRIRVVLGNSSCDLDSAVCTLVQSFFYYHELSDDDKQINAVIPVMNVSDNEYRVKTEVVWFLKDNKIPSNLLTFRNQINLTALAKEKRLQLTLVDHHVLTSQESELVDSVVEVVDHRPQDPLWMWPNATFTLEPVGSCATLIAKNIFLRNPNLVDAQLSHLLRGPILVDTYNLSAEAGRAKPMDVEVIGRLESLETSSKLPGRCELYDKLLEAKTDISELTPTDLLIKDLKVVDNVALPGFPMLVEKFIEMPNALEDVLCFMRARSFTLTILLGMDLKGEKIRRDIGVLFPRMPGQQELAAKIISSLMESSDPPFTLQRLVTKQVEDPEAKEEGCSYTLHAFKQENVQATRKQILPIIQRALAKFHCQC